MNDTGHDLIPTHRMCALITLIIVGIWGLAAVKLYMAARRFGLFGAWCPRRQNTSLASRRSEKRNLLQTGRREVEVGLLF